MSADNLRSKLESSLGTNADRGGFTNGDKSIGLVVYKSKLYNERFGLSNNIDINNDSGFVLQDSIIGNVLEEPTRLLGEYDPDSYLKPFCSEVERTDGFEAVVDGRRFLIGRDRYFDFEGNFMLMTESNVVSLLCSPLWSPELRAVVSSESDRSDSQMQFKAKTIEALRSIDEGYAIADITELINHFISSSRGMTADNKQVLIDFFGVDEIEELPLVFQSIGLQVISTTSRYINAEDPTRDSLTEVDSLMEAVRVSIPKFNKSLGL